jgi:hypothetical protein
MAEPTKPRLLEEVGGLPDEIRVTLGLYADDLDPEDVSRRMGCAPTHAHKKAIATVLSVRRQRAEPGS